MPVTYILGDVVQSFQRITPPVDEMKMEIIPLRFAAAGEDGIDTAGKIGAADDENLFHLLHPFLIENNECRYSYVAGRERITS